MNTLMIKTLESSLSISAVERETGIAKDTLRVWEKRYGFPKPLRDAQGNRAYPADQVVQLRSIAQLLAVGLRPKKIVGLSNQDLEQLLQEHVQPDFDFLSKTKIKTTELEHVALTPFLMALTAHEPDTLRHLLIRAQAKMGIERFVLEVVAPLTTAIGTAWAEGQFEIYEEHLYTEIITGVLHQAISSLTIGTSVSSLLGPKVLLTTLPKEPHGLGLLMVETMLTLEGCRCVSLGTQTPLCNIVRAAQAHQADIVALSFTAYLSHQYVHESLHELRAELPPQFALWVGGANVALYQKPLDGITALPLLTDLAQSVEQWRRKNRPRHR